MELKKLEGFKSVDVWMPEKEGFYEVYSPTYFDGIGKLKYDGKGNWIMNKYIKKIFKVEYWREIQKNEQSKKIL